MLVGSCFCCFVVLPDVQACNERPLRAQAESQPSVLHTDMPCKRTHPDNRYCTYSAATVCRVKKAEGTASKGGSLLRSWGDKDPLKRPSCALLVCLVQSMLRQADTVTITAVVTSRCDGLFLVGGCLSFVHILLVTQDGVTGQRYHQSVMLVANTCVWCQTKAGPCNAPALGALPCWPLPLPVPEPCILVLLSCCCVLAC